MTTMNGSALFLTQFVGDKKLFNCWGVLVGVAFVDAVLKSLHRKGAWVNV
jgi:hypothetical protein